jgi:hypothetical protein
MALIICKECTKEISDSAKQCPHCGYKKKKQSWFWPLMIVFLFLAYCGQDEIMNKNETQKDKEVKKIIKSKKVKTNSTSKKITLADRGIVRADPCSKDYIFYLDKGETVTSINQKRVWYGILGVVVHTIDISKYNKGAKYGWISDQWLQNPTKPLIDKSKIGNKCSVEKLKN